MTSTTTSTGTTSASAVSRWREAILGSYAAPRLALVRGSGAVVTDEDGRDYVDLLAGIATNVLGHAHPAVVQAVSTQVATLGHTSNLFANEPSVTLAERLLALLGGPGRVFFCNSGAEANEAAFKIARRTGRTKVVAAQDAFHGRTMGALSLTGQPGKQRPFEPLVPGVVHVPFGDVEALRAAVDGDTAAVILEPVLGEAGVVVPPEGYLAAAREITSAAGALLVLDEVQTGIGRTGEWFAHLALGVRPDVVTLAKGLGGGLPLGACVALGDAAALLQPGDHGSTFGGNPVSCAAGLAVLDTLVAEDLLARAKSLGERISSGITALGHPAVSHVRGAGLLLGVVLTRPVAAATVAALQASGFLANAPAPGVIRLAPPLVLTDEQADAFVAALGPALDVATAPEETP
ncbi:acetylornithine aminotransferase [Motilibacter rhizosphaerae]|uniref:Acetylornithine aminotransferase n=1 Tax=Motilibacter rhizosphaerae TaxID=598652 RepID=A0A4Q7NQM2_9ACTN|nr:acetylornithine transaminase [Motilibacter rhizosphaerae]RZS89343.1 acetylornithine aminotransferase [Motilibacter rhizosphaerae]